jgi:nucleolar protein 15
MNNYILFDKILKCSVVEDTSKYALLFKKWKKKFVFADKYKKYLLEKNKPKSKEEMKEYVTSLLKKEEEKRKKLEEMGIAYDFPGFVNFINIESPYRFSK